MPSSTSNDYKFDGTRNGLIRLTFDDVSCFEYDDDIADRIFSDELDSEILKGELDAEENLVFFFQ